MTVKEYLQLVHKTFTSAHRYSNPDSSLCNYCKGAKDVVSSILNDLPEQALSLEMDAERT